MSEDDFEMEEQGGSDDPQWSALTTEQKKELMMVVFDDEEWYGGTPAHIGGASLPEFGEIATRLSAPKNDIMKYYAAWVKTKGLDPAEIMKRGQTMTQAAESQPTQQTTNPMQSAASAVASSGNMSKGVGSQMKNAMMNDMMGSMFDDNTAKEGGGDMKYMMGMMMMSNMLESERRQHEAQMQMQREQFSAGQNNSIRQEQQQRQDMMMTQQMSFMNNMFKQGMNKQEDEFGSLLKSAAMDKLADNMFGGGESTAERIISKVLDPTTIGAAIAGAKGAMGARPTQVPAGYDVPSYNPYAQPIPPQAQPSQPPEAQEQELSGFFEGPEQEGPSQMDVEVSNEEYQQSLLTAFEQHMGNQLEDEKTRSALVEQIDIAIDVVKMRHPELTPQNKLEIMSQQLILVRSLRDIGMGMREAKGYVENGMNNDTVVDGIKSELQKQPVFYQIFSENTYEEMMGIIEPFKSTGGVIHDYNYLLQPDIANLCRSVLEAVKQG
jgi:hypothetical protein